jgi:hypothetical protein
LRFRKERQELCDIAKQIERHLPALANLRLRAQKFEQENARLRGANTELESSLAATQRQLTEALAAREGLEAQIATISKVCTDAKAPGHSAPHSPDVRQAELVGQVLELEVLPVVEGAQAKYAELGGLMHQLSEVCGALSGSPVNSASQPNSPVREARPTWQKDGVTATVGHESFAEEEFFDEEEDALVDLSPGRQLGRFSGDTPGGGVDFPQMNAMLDELLQSDDDDS